MKWDLAGVDDYKVYWVGECVGPFLVGVNLGL